MGTKSTKQASRFPRLVDSPGLVSSMHGVTRPFLSFLSSILLLFFFFIPPFLATFVLVLVWVIQAFDIYRDFSPLRPISPLFCLVQLVRPEYKIFWIPTELTAESDAGENAEAAGPAATDSL